VDFEVSFQEAEKILFWLKRLRAAVSVLTPPSHGGLIEFRGKQRSEKSPIESVAVLRANISTVLDAVERFTRVLENGDRAVIEARYFRQMTWREVSQVTHFSNRTCYRIRDRLIPQYQRLLENLGPATLAAFWQSFDILFGEGEL